MFDKPHAFLYYFLCVRCIVTYESDEMEIDQLRYFLRVAERGNFTRAAKDLMISQPALSRSVQKLEEELAADIDDETRQEIATKLKVISKQRKKGLEVLQELKKERDATQ